MPEGAIEPAGVTVLTVEDNPADRRLIEIALNDGAREAGTECMVLTADRVSAALELLAGNPRGVDAILLDLGLPDATGFEGLFGIQGATADTPIIMLTGLSDIGTATDALKFGAADYVEKDDLRPRTIWRAIQYAIERKRIEAKFQEMADTDPLTGVLNRRAFVRHLDAALENARRAELSCGLLTFDVDGFKAVNDAHGHSVGDELLKEIASRTRALLRRTDAVGRIGGDEFAVVAANLKSASGAFEVAEKISEAVTSIRKIGEVRLATRTSIGIVCYPDDEAETDVLLAHADMAMYKSKKGSGGQINYYDHDMDRELKARHKLRKQLKEDISLGRLQLEYQPIVEAQSGLIVSAEALARWRDATNRVIAPGEFIPFAEETGLISSLGMSVAEKACAQLGEGIKAGVEMCPVSINVSPIQCHDPSFAYKLITTIMEAGIEPRLINVEITESSIMRNVETSMRNFEHLKDFGIGIHVDDFGTGYSSLSLLKDLPVDLIKIDRSLVAGIADDSSGLRIVEAIAELANKLHLRSVAEGVETVKQARTLRGVGVHYLQGHLFARALGFKRFCEVLKSGAALNARFEPGLASDRAGPAIDRIENPLVPSDHIGSA